MCHLYISKIVAKFVSAFFFNPDKAMLRNLWKYIQKKLAYFRRVKYSLMVNYKKKSKPKKKKKNNPDRLPMIMIAVVGLIGLFLFLKYCSRPSTTAQDTGCEAAIENYGHDIKILAHQFDLPPEYLMAVIMLECSGKRDVPARFEQGVYNKLVEIKERKRASLESITHADLKDANDDALRNLASSWGPFQLMGYKCLHLGIKIKDLRGSTSLYYGVKWIDGTYGNYVRKGQYADAFHIHNTGRPVPKNGKYTTYHAHYVPDGLKYMEYFKEHL